MAILRNSPHPGGANRAAGLRSALVRASVLLVCAFILWRSFPLALADFYASSGTAEGYRRALALEPGNADLVSARAVFLAVTADPSPAIDQALHAAVALNPADAEALMSLGLRAELRGDNAAAQSALERAASVSHLFKPAWTLANFYFRTGQDAQFRPMLQRCLGMIEPQTLQPMSFDPSPIFDLAWHQDPDPVRIRALIPNRPATLVPYLRWLSTTGRLDPALSLWPDALAVADPALPQDTDAILGFDETLLAANRPLDAASVWNDALQRGFVHSSPLDPAAGISLENPDFAFPSISRALSWYPARQPGLFVTQAPHSLRFELTGGEPEVFELLSKLLPVAPGRTWHLAWNADTSRLENLPASASGLSFTIDERPDISPHPCPPLDRSGPGSCDFSTLGSTRVLRLSLRYQRPPGSTRLKGVLVFSAIHLVPAP